MNNSISEKDCMPGFCSPMSHSTLSEKNDSVRLLIFINIAEKAGKGSLLKMNYLNYALYHINYYWYGLVASVS